eukprot:CAMPEP_0117442212 /NCGR_PEP_ID=MMETSP0759-20121206/4034_1 /TAXON_ID=63605 /ORGANISM="Percolomonas cosmopolitus, Strain WS" /LENGTH=1221 /DNA_ID=CAMNT_0005234091 /DNA_START=145 /DNA_END=3810 /DNA_ORIENTATION=-
MRGKSDSIQNEHNQPALERPMATETEHHAQALTGRNVSPDKPHKKNQSSSNSPGTGIPSNQSSRQASPFTPNSRPQSSQSTSSHRQASNHQGTQTLLQSTSYDILSEQLTQTRQTLLTFQKQHQNTLNSLRKHSNVSKVESEERKVLRRQVDFFKQLAMEYERQVNGGMENDLFELRRELGNLTANNQLLTQELQQEREKNEQLQKELDDLALTSQSQMEELDMISQRESSLIAEKNELTEQLLESAPEKVAALQKEMEQLKISNCSLRSKLKTSLTDMQYTLLTEAKKLSSFDRSHSQGLIDTALVLKTKLHQEDNENAFRSGKRRSSLPAALSILVPDDDSQEIYRNNKNGSSPNTTTKRKHTKKLSPLKSAIEQSTNELTVSPSSPSSPLTQYTSKSKNPQHLSAHTDDGSTIRSHSTHSSGSSPSRSSSNPQRSPSIPKKKELKRSRTKSNVRRQTKGADTNKDNTRVNLAAKRSSSPEAPTRNRSEINTHDSSQHINKRHKSPHKSPHNSGAEPRQILRKSSSYRHPDKNLEERRKQRQGLHPVASVNDIDKKAQEYTFRQQQEQQMQKHQERMNKRKSSTHRRDRSDHSTLGENSAIVNGYVNPTNQTAQTKTHFPLTVLDNRNEHSWENSNTNGRTHKHNAQKFSSSAAPRWERQHPKYVSKLHGSMDLQEHITSHEPDETVIKNLDMIEEGPHRIRSGKRKSFQAGDGLLDERNDTRMIDSTSRSAKFTRSHQSVASSQYEGYHQHNSPSGGDNTRRQGEELPFELPAQQNTKRHRKKRSPQYRLVQPTQHKDSRSLYRGKLSGSIVEKGRLMGHSHSNGFVDPTQSSFLASQSSHADRSTHMNGHRLVQRETPHQGHPNQMQQYSTNNYDSPERVSTPTIVHHTYRRNTAIDGPHFPQRTQKPLNFRGEPIEPQVTKKNPQHAEDRVNVTKDRTSWQHANSGGDNLRRVLNSSENDRQHSEHQEESSTRGPVLGLSQGQDAIVASPGEDDNIFSVHGRGTQEGVKKIILSKHDIGQYDTEDDIGEEIDTKVQLHEDDLQGKQLHVSVAPDGRTSGNAQHPHQFHPTAGVDHSIEEDIRRASLDEVQLMIGSNPYPSTFPRKKLIQSMHPSAKKRAVQPLLMQPGSMLGGTSPKTLHASDLRIDNRKVRTPASPPEEKPKRRVSPPAAMRLYELSKLQKQASAPKLPKPFGEDVRLSKSYGASTVSSLLNYTE